MSHKQSIVIRKDLKMRVGKACSQAAHASMAAILNLGIQGTRELKIPLTDDIAPWLLGNFKKVCVYVESEEELLALHQKAKDAGVITALITDSGLTEFHGVPTNTCIAVGPDFEAKVDEITGHLKLL